jgi:uncharacterized membrane protein
MPFVAKGKKVNFRKKTTISLLIALLFLGGLIYVISQVFEPYHDVEINTYHADVTLNDSGDMTIKETFDMTYNDDMRVRFRDIKYNKYPSDYELEQSASNVAFFDEDTVDVTVFRDGQNITDIVEIGYSFNNDYDELGNPVACEPPSDTCESIFVDTGSTGGLSGDITFIYEYTILGAVTEYSDISELNWVFFEYMEGPIHEGSMTITLPDNSFTTDDLYIWGHGIEEGQLDITSNTQFDITFEGVGDGEFLEIRTLMPPSLFPNIETRNQFITDDMTRDIIVEYQENQIAWDNMRITIAQILLGVSIFVALLMVYIAYKMYKKYFAPYKTDFDGDYFRELPSEESPAEIGYMYYYKHTSSEDITATLLDLIRIKHILMTYDAASFNEHSSDFTLTLNEDAPDDTLKPHEAHLIKWFINDIGDGHTVTTKQIESFGSQSVTKAKQFEMSARSFKLSVRKTAREHDYFDTGILLGKRRARAYLAIPIIVLIISIIGFISLNIGTEIAMVISALTAIIYAGYVQGQEKLSQAGQEKYNKWDAFRNFLTDFGSFEDYPMPGIIVWEHFLVYATTLKVADQVMKQLEVKMPLDEQSARRSTYLGVGYGRRGFYTGYAFRSLSSTTKQASFNAKKKISSARASAAGRGGGFGGGSSGGGGGGGGRSR